jgi:hypothetical protein
MNVHADVDVVHQVSPARDLQLMSSLVSVHATEVLLELHHYGRINGHRSGSVLTVILGVPITSLVTLTSLLASC